MRTGSCCLHTLLNFFLVSEVHHKSMLLTLKPHKPAYVAVNLRYIKWFVTNHLDTCVVYHRKLIAMGHGL
jgi:hypothetical protein